MGKFKDLTGKTFGKLTVIQATNKRKRGAVVWKCKCECGNIVDVARNNLEQGNTKSCGCLQAKKVSTANKDRQTKNIKNQKFGKLTAIEATDKREQGYIIWKCLCECGCYTYVNSHNLICGNTKSCGCLRSKKGKENAPKNLSKFKEENYIGGTKMYVINNNKLNKNNTTGYTGVYFRKKDEKYIALIEFQKKRYFLGSYNTKEEASIIRKEAEDRLYSNFFKWYNSLKNK